MIPEIMLNYKRIRYDYRIVEACMSVLEVVEKFVSINGEGTKAGQLAVIIRLKGCNLNCKY